LLSEAGTLPKSAQGTCLRAYSPAEQTGDPVAGRSSANPVNVLPARSRADARFGATKSTGQLSSVTPCVLPEKSAR
jgi:hypothetical protein